MQLSKQEEKAHKTLKKNNLPILDLMYTTLSYKQVG